MMRNSLSIAEDLFFAALFVIAVAVMTYAMIFAGEEGRPLVRSASVVVTDPGKTDGNITPSSAKPPPLYVSETTAVPGSNAL